MRNVCRLLTRLDGVSEVEVNKSENNSFSDHMGVYRLWHIRSFIYTTLDIINGLRIDAEVE